MGIRIFTFGVGTDEGAPIPIKRNGVIDSYKKDMQGETVITKRNPIILKEIAQAAEGNYVDGNDTQAVVDFVAETLKNMDKKSLRLRNL